MTVAPAPVADPYDLGDTEAYIEKAPSGATGEGSSKPAPVIATEPAKPAPPRDPQTGQFVKAPEKPTHPTWLLNQVRQLDGLFDEDDLSLPTEQLQKQVMRALHQQTKLREENALARTLAEAQVPTPAVEPKPPEEESLDSLSEELHPPLARLLQKYDQRISQLESQLKDVRQFQDEAKRNVEETKNQAMDRTIVESADPEAVGTGPISSLQPNSPQYHARISIFQTAKRLVGDKADFRTVRAAVSQAAQMLRMSKPPTSATAPLPKAGQLEKPRISEEEWKQAGLAVPTHRNGAPEIEKGDQLATMKLAERMRNAGYDAPTEDTEILETLL